METTLFNYSLPEHLIAQHPPEGRDNSRMLVLHRKRRTIEHRSIREIGQFLTPKDRLVMNNTRVMPARLFGQKETGGKIELLLLREEQPYRWRVLMKSSRRPTPGSQLTLCEGLLRATMIADGEQGEALLQFESEHPILDLLETYGLPPLPPYISRHSSEAYAADRDRYQTVYATQLGAAAAPTAGLHFTPDLLGSLQAQGIQRSELTLHVGLGTFRPVSTAQITDHHMHAEEYEVNAKTAAELRATRAENGRLVAIGSTSVRTLESLSELKAARGETDIFIYPPYTFRHTDAILTNFHLPQSTLLMMMSAFADRELLLQAYHEAITAEYRFFSYGDCMLIL
jgi:S-adenosylmethionine:tRNA ribosyltransferase-isomerase